MNEKRHIKVLGLGNILLGDDGFGVHFTRWFEKRYSLPENVEVVDGGTLGYNLLDTITSCDDLVVVDLIKTDDIPGSIYRFNMEEMESKLPDPTSAHEVEFFHVLVQAELMGENPNTAFLCIVPESYGEMDTNLSDLMKDRFPKMEELLIKELASLGIEAKRI